MEDVALAPALEHLLLEGGKRLLGIDGCVAGHGGERFYVPSGALDLPRSLRILLDAAGSVASRSQAAKVAIARLDGVVDPEALPAELRRPVAGAIERMVARTAEPLDPKAVETLLAEAWDERPSSVLDELDPEPLAVRPHAQAHRAVLEGDDVVVKVARPGVAAATRSDLALLETLAAPATAAFPAIDAGALIAEVRERVIDELDLEHEAQVHRRAARALRAVEGVSAPAALTAWCTEGVLVTEFAAGPDPGRPGRARRRRSRGDRPVAGAGVRGRPAGDRGGARQPARKRRRARAGRRHRAARPGLHARGRAGTAGGRHRRGRGARAPTTPTRSPWPPTRSGSSTTRPRSRPTASRASLAAHLIDGPARLDAAALAAVGDRALGRIDDLMTVGVRATPAAADLWPARCFGQVLPLLARLEVEEDWVALGLDAARRGWAS